MVYWTAIQNKGMSLDSRHHNETFRARNHYKETHIHNAPKRKNKDFKPVLYGDFVGMLNFKLSEPFAMIRHIKDLFTETHHMPLNWIYNFIKGATLGGFAGIARAALDPTFSSLILKKMQYNETKNPFNLHVWKTFWPAMQRPSLITGTVFMGYNVLLDFFTHHREALNEPPIITHMKVWAVLVPILTIYFNKYNNILAAYFYSAILLFPTFWAIRNVTRGGNIFNKEIQNDIYYTDGVSQAEKDLYRYQDEIESRGMELSTLKNYGYTNYTRSDAKY